MSQASIVAHTVVPWKINQLHEHPYQAQVHPGRDDAADQELADDLRLNGLQHPIDITPGGTIICGHRRVRAARRLGWDEIDARVRHDLVQQGPAAVQAWLVTDNLNRRQLSPLEVARSYAALRELAPQLPHAQQQHYQGTDLRDQLAQRFHMSGRNLDRLRRLLSAPAEVQNAVSANQLSLKAAGRVAGAPQKVQRTIAKAIAAGENPEAVVARLLPPPARKRVFNTVAFVTFLRHLRQDVPDLEGRLASTEGRVNPLGPEQAELLRRTTSVIERYLDRAGVLTAKQAEAGRQQRDRTLAALAGKTPVS